jgi:putative ABC transport system ATP-binding protein
MGPSGSGKTTLLNLVSTIDTPSFGSIIYDGVDITQMKPKQLSEFRRENIGFIFQDFNLLDSLSAKENIALPLALSGVKSDEIEARILSVSKHFGIDEHLHKYPYQLSGGQKQRTAAARAIIRSPKLILADEPTGALDSKSSADLLQSLADLNESQNATIMMVTHDAYAASFSKRVLFIKDGLIHAEILKGHSRKEFYQRIMDMIASLGGSADDIA